MRIPPYWAKETHTGLDRKGRQQSFAAYGWSFESLAAAKNDALARAGRIFDRLTSDGRVDTYDYLEHPLRQEIVTSTSRRSSRCTIVMPAGTRRPPLLKRAPQCIGALNQKGRVCG